MERQSFWWRTTAPELAGLGSSGFGFRGLAMAQRRTLLLFSHSKFFRWRVGKGLFYRESSRALFCMLADADLPLSLLFSSIIAVHAAK